MDKETARRIVKNGLKEYLEGRGIDTAKPFHCLNPDHADHHPSMRYYEDPASGPRCKCFSCGANYDTIDVIKLDYGLATTADAFRKAYELFRLDVDGMGSGTTTGQQRVQPIHKAPAKEEKDVEAPDFSKIVEAAHERLMKGGPLLDYIHGRGLSDELIERYRIGYDPAGYNHFMENFPKHQTRLKKEKLYQLFFPYLDNQGKVSYFLSEITDRSQLDSYHGKYLKIKGLPAQIFNERYITAGESAPRVVFITEGIYDALAVEEVGGKAIALTGVGENRLLNLCQKYRPRTTFIIALDSDKAGQDAAAGLKSKMDAAGIACQVRARTAVKDENEELVNGREAFQQSIQNIMDEVEAEDARKEREERAAYMHTAAAWRMQSFYDEIEESRKAPCYPTGFSSLDKILDGGLYPGLYIVGAISSLGKTTFCLQIGDNIAKGGHDVLIFSLEMASLELIAKSLSRLTFLLDWKERGSYSNAKTTRGILAGARYDHYSEEEKGLIIGAVSSYTRYAERIYIHEGVGDIGVEKIRRTVAEHIRITGNRPVVIVDYIQILAPYNDHATDKQNTDKAVIELKRISRDFSIPVIGISSFNRDNYTAPVNMASFKESGAVEYSSDVLIGLQYEGMDYQENESKENRMKRIREIMQRATASGKTIDGQSIELKVLKNRNGSKGVCNLGFIPMFNYFSDETEAKKKQAEKEELEWETVEDEED